MADRIVYYDGCFVNYFDHETGVAVVAVKKVISARSQARGLANDWPMDGKTGQQSGALRQAVRSLSCPERAA